jgi:hypothetical protein
MIWHRDSRINSFITSMPAFMRSGATRAERTADEVLRRAGLPNATAGDVKAAQRDTAQNSKATTTETRIMAEVEEEAALRVYTVPLPPSRGEVRRAEAARRVDIHGHYGWPALPAPCRL